MQRFVGIACVVWCFAAACATSAAEDDAGQDAAPIARVERAAAGRDRREPERQVIDLAIDAFGRAYVTTVDGQCTLIKTLAPKTAPDAARTRPSEARAVHALRGMQRKQWLRYLVIPAVIAFGFGIWLMFARLGIEGIVLGGLLFVAGIDLFFIGASQPPRLRHA
ncbi:MAG TPA: hypothetical protein VGH28_21500 [Polyangiaceae bacterium]|jgi:hypothetical protein